MTLIGVYGVVHLELVSLLAGVVLYSGGEGRRNRLVLAFRVTNILHTACHTVLLCRMVDVDIGEVKEAISRFIHPLIGLRQGVG